MHQKILTPLAKRGSRPTTHCSVACGNGTTGPQCCDAGLAYGLINGKFAACLLACLPSLLAGSCIAQIYAIATDADHAKDRGSFLRFDLLDRPIHDDHRLRLNNAIHLCFGREYARYRIALPAGCRINVSRTAVILELCCLVSVRMCSYCKRRKHIRQ